jgi:hypothetical protein
MYVCATYNRYIRIRILLFYCNECTLWLSFAQQKAKSKKKNGSIDHKRKFLENNKSIA